MAASLPPIYEDLTRSIRVRHLQTPLEDALCLPTGTSHAKAVELLRTHNLDYAPVTDTTGEGVLGFVARAQLDPGSPAPVNTELLSPEAPRLVSADANLDGLLRCLHDSEFLLVLDDNWISGLVTTADLDKQAARAFFYVLLVSVEVACAELIRASFSRQAEAVKLLSPDRGQRVRDRYSEALLRNAEADLVAYMDPADLLTIIGKTPSARTRLGVSRTGWEDMTGFLPTLRNDVVHPVRSLTAVGGLATLVEHKDRLENLVRLLTRPAVSGGRAGLGG